ncbi:MAG: hypothetical protein CFE46_08920 [Burkholderiales bacterium PBB6]|nr:MAG: hypothetical protein CFE46_08920 [Burkholderiales bacterium PBB6]
MRQTHSQANPFMMMMNPEAILQAVERSERLSGLQRRICRPLDKPLIPKVSQSDLDAYDNDIDADIDMCLEDDSEV